MSIKLCESGFHEWHDHGDDGPGLGIDSSRVDACIKRFHEGSFTGLFGSPSFAFAQEDLNFLKETPAASWLWFWDIKLKDIDGIYALKNLGYFGIHPKRPAIDFSVFKKLRSVVNHWLPKDHGITDSTISEYFLWHYKPKHKTFHELQLPRGIEKWELTWGNPDSLEGLPEMPRLHNLEFHCCRNLRDLSHLPKIAPKLRRLIITSSSKVDMTDGVLNHPALELAIHNGNKVVDGRPDR